MDTEKKKKEQLILLVTVLDYYKPLSESALKRRTFFKRLMIEGCSQINTNFDHVTSTIDFRIW